MRVQLALGESVEFTDKVGDTSVTVLFTKDEQENSVLRVSYQGCALYKRGGFDTLYETGEE